MFDPVEQIKSKIDIVDLVSQYVKLTRSGKNYRGLCPFHQEKTPSFMVSPDRQIAYCFGCNKGGDIFKFVMEVERLDFPEALEKLGKRCGVEITQNSSFSNSNKEIKNRLSEIMKTAHIFFKEQFQHPESKEARKYLEKRGMTAQDIEIFQLGFAPDSYDALLKYLEQKGYNKKEMLQASLLTTKENNEEHVYDKFRNRIIFPIHNIEGEIIAFAGRVMDDSLPKYLNSAETALYHKSNILFNLHRAKESMKQKNSIIVVEGYMDAIACYRIGIENVVAVCGTALTEQHIKLMKRYTDHIIFCMDSDEAGIRATERNASLALKQEMHVNIIPLTNYKDPDEYIAQNQKEFEENIQKPQNIVDFFLTHYQKQEKLETSEGRRLFLNALFPLIASIPYDTEKMIYLQKLASMVQTNRETLEKDFLRFIKNEPRKKEEISKSSAQNIYKVEYILGILLLYPEYVEIFEQQIPQFHWQDDFLKKVYNHIKDEYTAKALYALAQDTGLTHEEKEVLQILMLTIEKICGDNKQELLKALMRLIAWQKNEKRKQITSHMSAIKREGGTPSSQNVLEEINNMTFIDTYKNS